MIINVGEFIFSVDFIVLKNKSFKNPRGQIDVIPSRPFLATSNVLINCHSCLMKLTFENMTVDLNIFNLERQLNEPSNKPLDVNLI